jgi:putative ABC transport system substrate-binding protein
MKRREFITLIGGAAASWPLAVRAQQRDEVRRIGVVVNVAADDPEAQASVAAFKQALQQLGWSEGRNLQIDFRGAAYCAPTPRDLGQEYAGDGGAPEANAYNPDRFHGGLRPRRRTLRGKPGASGR